MKMRTLLRTIHGSHLYGLAHDNSDVDYYVVVDDGRARQTINDGIDTNTLSFDKFISLCYKGVPQALEAMFSQQADIDEISYFRNGWKAGGSEVVDTYRRTIKSLSFDERHTTKYRRHAARLAYNLRDIVEHGRFNPRLDDFQISMVTGISVMEDKDFVKAINWISTIEIFHDGLDIDVEP